MKDSVHFGINRTGIQMAPRLSREMLEGNDQMDVPVVIDARMTADSLRELYIRGSGAVGTVPMPGTARGALTTGLQKITGRHPEVLLDKLGERLAFERSGVRLYDALVIKCEAVLPEVEVQPLRSFRNEEAQHFDLVRDTLESLGADATAQTPCADVSAVASMGLMQVLTDPRTDIPQCVEAILSAELIDNAGWELLIELAEDAGLDDAVGPFRQAKIEEDIHLDFMRTWLRRLVVDHEPVANNNIDTE